ncbi:LpqB family beta-propeller domain-containing protein [Actinophytocola sp.]|uniref:LpqB family beta-propeller domain-containing protein n=1 Tax=Actinophytocola sp. TaxID=1872138 RepID=UPI002D7F1B77|nr:LpqB family beta-propeller domain-containing protein [Actinophytocola sp.]HET9142798.1 LpqB family beta-propeller domain-containing protein [Actinophytocola sp.]
MAAHRTRRLVLAAGLVAVAALSSACANIPDRTTPQPVSIDGAQGVAGEAPLPNPTADPYTLVRDFVGKAGNPEAAKKYLTEAARPTWQGDAPPMIINETFNTAPLPPQERRAQGDESGNEVTVVLTVSFVGRLGPDRSFIPAVGSHEYTIVVRRDSEDAPWRIATPPESVLITPPVFKQSYRLVNVYFFDPSFQAVVPDPRYVAAQPLAGLPDRVVRLLVDGPSAALGTAVRSLIGPDAEIRTNAVSDPDDGAVVVNLTKIGDRTPDDRRLIAAQIVLSLRDVTQSRVRLLVDNNSLVSGRADWRPSDLPSYDSATRPNADLPGLFSASGRVFSLNDGTPVPGPAGSGEIEVQSAAQSFDGKMLAVVQEVSTGSRLRIGEFGRQLVEVNLEASTLTRPTWLFGTEPAPSNEVWTVQDGFDVVRVIRTGNGSWATSRVNASELRSFGTITDLRLSRDGARIAAVINGQVVVASVVRDQDSVAIRSPRRLRETEVTGVVGVDWLSQQTLVAATSQSSQPVVNISVDGFKLDRYNSANLGSPVSAIAAAPDRGVVVTDRSGMWGAAEVLQVWRLEPHSAGPGARPFYPG